MWDYRIEVIMFLLIIDNDWFGRVTRNKFSGCGVPASRASFSTIFVQNCGRGEGLGTTTCLITVVGVKQGHATLK